MIRVDDGNVADEDVRAVDLFGYLAGDVRGARSVARRFVDFNVEALLVEEGDGLLETASDGLRLVLNVALPREERLDLLFGHRGSPACSIGLSCWESTTGSPAVIPQEFGRNEVRRRLSCTTTYSSCSGSS